MACDSNLCVRHRICSLCIVSGRWGHDGGMHCDNLSRSESWPRDHGPDISQLLSCSVIKYFAHLRYSIAITSSMYPAAHAPRYNYLYDTRREVPSTRAPTRSSASRRVAPSDSRPDVFTMYSSVEIGNPFDNSSNTVRVSYDDVQYRMMCIV